MSLTIAYVGNFRPRTPEGEPFSTESHISASLELLGHRVIRLQEDRVNAGAVFRAVMAEGAQLLLWTRTWADKLREGGLAMLQALRSHGIPTVAYHLDLYAGLPRARDIGLEPWWHCQYVFTADGGSDTFWAEHGVNHIWAPPGVFGPECYMAEPGPERYEVIFVGSGSNGYHPEWPYRKQLIDWLHATYRDRFRCFGRGGYKESVRGAALNQLYASSKVVVGDSLCLGFSHARYWSDRVPETLGRGGCLIHPKIAGLEEHFGWGEHLMGYRFGDFEDLRLTIDMLLEHDKLREDIRRDGHNHVKKTATYEHRMRWMLETVAREEPALAALVKGAA
jgi:hypothetical protein